MEQSVKVSYNSAYWNNPCLSGAVNHLFEVLVELILGHGVRGFWWRGLNSKLNPPPAPKHTKEKKKGSLHEHAHWQSFPGDKNLSSVLMKCRTLSRKSGADLSDADLRGADFSLANVTKVS